MEKETTKPTAEIKTSESIFKAPAINLPKGGGAIRGIGEKFAANPVTGTGSLSVPIYTSPGRSGFGPQLSISYDSGAGNGPFGFGWNLSLPSITRKTDKGLPTYQDAAESDVFILSGAEDLVPVFKQDQGGNWVRDGQDRLVFDEVDRDGYLVRRYRPRIEGLFARIERWTKAAGPRDVHWRSISKDNVLTLYGKDPNSRIADPTNPQHIFSWLICETRDDKGNAVIYEYKSEDGAGVDPGKAHERNRGDRGDIRRTANRYLKRIYYGNRKPLLAEETGKRPQQLTDEQIKEAGWVFEVVLDYGEHDVNAPEPDDGMEEWIYRDDPFSSYRAGFEIRTTRLCQRVLMFHHIPDISADEKGYDGLVHSTDFDYSYEQDPTNARNPIYTFLRKVIQTGYRRQGGGYLKRSLPPVEFEYTQPAVQNAVQDVDTASLENLPIGVDGTSYQWTDLHGEGIPGILTEQADGWFYKRNLSPISERPVEFGPLERVDVKPNLTLAGGQAQFMDLAGDGQPDLVMLDDPTPGFYEHDGAEGWLPFRPFTARLNCDMHDPNQKFVDLNGDGHTDVLISENDVFIWHASLAEEGFGPACRVAQAMDEEKGPRLVFADGTQSIYLADFSGDGLTDLARVRNGEVCYWPNLGYGRFGARVTMDDAPWFDSPDQFDHKRVRLADIDGSGTTDIIYLHHDGVHLYFNQSGNSWSAPQPLRAFPHVDDLVSIAATDLLGNGTACLVWSSPLPGDVQHPMRYVDLMGGQKPHLLVKIINNLGAETCVRYAPSTKFYLKDKRGGKPWITRLPFPVHVVERVETYDHISRNRFVTRYAYHHGYFDGDEREFRGFGRVDQWDTEEYATLDTDGMLEDAENLDEASHVPPVLTRTWFHTGIYLGRHRVSNFFAGLLDGQGRGEYYREPAWRDDDDDDMEARKYLLSDTVLPSDLTLEEEREACRALKGSMLRQEVYALDGTDKEEHPYTVTEQNFAVRCLQPHGGNRHAVFFTYPREAISYHYERNPTDPRISHTLTLEVDDFGNVLKQVAIGYGRRQSPLSEEQDREKQTMTLITYTENRFTIPQGYTGTEDSSVAIDEIDDYRAPLPCETRTYELTGFEPGNNAERFSFVEWARDDFASLTSAEETTYEQTVNRATKQKRLIEHVRTRYRKDDLTALLPLGQVQPLALPGESYKLAFTPGLLEQVYVRGGQNLLPTPADVLRGSAGDKGGYIDLDGDGHWWIPSGRIFYSPGSNDDAATELAEAWDHFFLPRRYRDPFHSRQFETESFVDYDDYDLLALETRDTLDNRVTVGEREYTLDDGTVLPAKPGTDYRVLQPRLVMDPNRNRTAAAFDALGLVVGTAVMGKPEDNPAQGDLLEDFVTDPLLTDLQSFIADPRARAESLLGKATTRFVYNLERYQRAGQPPFAATLARETHFYDPLPSGGLKIQVSFSYSDGFGRQIQKKIQAEAGDAPQREADGPLPTGDIHPGDLVHDAQGKLVQANTPHRWVGTGRTVYNNKGKPVKQYEPFFSATHLYEPEREMTDTGVSPTLFYDPVGRVVATLHPNHTYEKVVFDPWQQTTYDVNDTVTFAPSVDDDVKGFFLKSDSTPRIPTNEYLPTWYELRTDPSHAVEFAARYPDANDRVNETSAAAKAAAHADTPTTAHFDALGRPFLTIAHNKVVCPDHALDGTEEKYHTRVELDIEGNQREVRDEHRKTDGTWEQRIVMRYDYHMAGPEQDKNGKPTNANLIHQTSMEAGTRWMLNDVAGKPIRNWDSRGHEFRTVYDQLHRPVESYMSEGAEPALVEQTVYGETRSNPEANNLRGQVIQLSDQAGVITSDDYDFKGNLRSSRRQFAQEYKTTLDWSAAVPLEEPIYTSRTRYDALNRPIQLTAPHSDQPGIKINVIQPGYNEANLLEQVNVWLNQDAEPADLLDSAAANLKAVTDIDYNEKGQRTLIDYGNGVRTTHTYDPFTFRLTHLLTCRAAAAFPGDCPQPPEDWPGCQVQNLHYTYDPSGNITHIRDDAQQIIYFRNKRVEPSADYVYDAVYRLIEAAGREHLGQVGGAPIPHSHDDGQRVSLLHPGDGNAMGTYIERYVYDAVGNFLEMQHYGSDPAHPGWTRRYTYEETSLIEDGMDGVLLRTSNRLSSTQIGDGPSQPYGYDEHGNMTSMPHLPLMRWNYRDGLQATSRQDVGDSGCTPETTYYVYRADGQRMRKITERQNGTRQKERIYLGGFEIYREYNGATSEVGLERETLHIMDDKQRIALVETRTQGDDGTLPQIIRYQFGNHLGSASLELDDDAQIISYEEYTPYGSTSYQAVRSQTEIPKRYRYTGKERDEESGLYYYGVRYYVVWLGRWTSCDPLGISSGLDLFIPNKANPIRYSDEMGLSEEDTIASGKNKLEILDLVLSDYDYGWVPPGVEGTFCTLDKRYCSGYFKDVPDTSTGRRPVGAPEKDLPNVDEPGVVPQESEPQEPRNSNPATPSEETPVKTEKQVQLDLQPPAEPLQSTQPKTGKGVKTTPDTSQRKRNVRKSSQLSPSNKGDPASSSENKPLLNDPKDLPLPALEPIPKITKKPIPIWKKIVGTIVEIVDENFTPTTEAIDRFKKWNEQGEGKSPRISPKGVYCTGFDFPDLDEFYKETGTKISPLDRGFFHESLRSLFGCDIQAIPGLQSGRS